jgi:cyclophilin family peptidyl-prolyl cis-trans isomerase
VKAACCLALAVLAVLPCAAGAAPAPVSPLRALAIAEDQRAWSDGVLKGFLADTSAALRARAALAVGRLQDSTTVPALLPLLADAAAGVRREAVFALGQIGWKGARGDVERSLGDADSEVVDLAIEALGKIGDQAATAKVVPFLDSKRAEQQRLAAVALWRLADTSAVAPLIRKLYVRDPALRWRAAYALEKLPLPERIAPAVERQFKDSDPLVRAHAARTLGRVKSATSVRLLVGACKGEDDAVLVNAVRALQSIADTADSTQLAALHPLLRHSSAHVRVTAATALADSFAWVSAPKKDEEYARMMLTRGMDDEDAATRGACGRALVVRYGARGVASAQKLLADSSVYARVAVLDGVRQLGDSAIAAPLLKASLAPKRPLLERMTAAEIAGQLGGKTHSGLFAPLLSAVRNGVGDRDPLYAAACAGALGDWGDSASVKLLAKAYEAHRRDDEADARNSIRDALRQLAGQAYADSIQRAVKTRAASPVYAADFETVPSERGAILHTSAGDIEWAFDAAVAPQTVRNFVTLARRGYFDGLRVHRVVPDFVIQDGDPTGTGSGGPGWTIRCEYNRLRYEAGMVGMALSGKDTGGSQWFITLSPQPHLNGRYTIFAHVVRGLDVARRVTQGAVVNRVEILE